LMGSAAHASGLAWVVCERLSREEVGWRVVYPRARGGHWAAQEIRSLAPRIILGCPFFLPSGDPQGPRDIGISHTLWAQKSLAGHSFERRSTQAPGKRSRRPGGVLRSLCRLPGSGLLEAESDQSTLRQVARRDGRTDLLDRGPGDKVARWSVGVQEIRWCGLRQWQKRPLLYRRSDLLPIVPARHSWATQQVPVSQRGRVGPQETLIITSRSRVILIREVEKEPRSCPSCSKAATRAAGTLPIWPRKDRTSKALTPGRRGRRSLANSQISSSFRPPVNGNIANVESRAGITTSMRWLRRKHALP
jgi:hypothetical protein